MTGFQLFGFITLFCTVGILLVCFILYVWLMNKRHYKCPYCGQRFKASSTRTFFSFNSSANKVLTCPACGKNGLMEYQRDDAYDPDAEEAAKKEAAEDETGGDQRDVDS